MRSRGNSWGLNSAVYLLRPQTLTFHARYSLSARRLWSVYSSNIKNVYKDMSFTSDAFCGGRNSLAIYTK